MRKNNYRDSAINKANGPYIGNKSSYSQPNSISRCFPTTSCCPVASCCPTVPNPTYQSVFVGQFENDVNITSAGPISFYNNNSLVVPNVSVQPIASVNNNVSFDKLICTETSYTTIQLTIKDAHIYARDLVCVVYDPINKNDSAAYPFVAITDTIVQIRELIVENSEIEIIMTDSNVIPSFYTAIITTQVV